MTDPRDLIKRLADDLEGITEELVIPEYAHTEKERTDASLALVAEARAYLAQPEPEGPTDKQLLGCMLKAAASVPGGQCTGILDWDKEAIAAARAVLARWGSPVTATETP